MVHQGLKAAAELLALRSVDSLVGSVAICLFASLILRIVPRQNAASRFAVWFCALVAIAGVPVLSGIWSPAVGIASTTQHAVLQVPDTWAVYFLLLWTTVSLLLLIQVARSIWRLHVVRRSCVSIEPATLDLVIQETLRKHGAGRRVAVCFSRHIRVPAAVGLWRPSVVIPEWALKELSADDLNQVVLHELAHLRRWDDWTNLAQQIVKALLFFHPAVWWIEKKAALEREIACDDAVLAETARPRAYAECLARLAEKSFAHRSVALAQAALGKVRQISIRVSQILKTDRPAARRSGWHSVSLLLALFAFGCAGWFSRTPRLVAFEDQTVLPPAAVNARPSLPEFKPAVSQTSAPAQLTDLKFRETRSHRDSSGPRQMTAVRAKSSRNPPQNLIHLAAARPSTIPITETMWIVVARDGSAANVPILQIEMWRVMILHVPADSSIPLTPKKI